MKRILVYKGFEFYLSVLFNQVEYEDVVKHKLVAQLVKTPFNVGRDYRVSYEGCDERIPRMVEQAEQEIRNWVDKHKAPNEAKALLKELGFSEQNDKSES